MTARPHVVVIGGGVAGLETVLALSALGGDSMTITLVTPDESFVELQDSPSAALLGATLDRHAIAELIAPSGANLRRGRVTRVRPEAHVVELASGEWVAYDALVLAIGCHAERAFDRGTSFDPQDPQVLASWLRDIELGVASRLAIVAPAGHHWTLPVFELALLSAEHGRRAGIDELAITVAVPEAEPLGVFGARGVETARGALAAAGIGLWTSAFTELHEATPLELRAHPGPRTLDVDRVLALPRLVPPRIPGLDAQGPSFLSVDGFGRVRGISDVYAVGDITSFAVKQGGLAAQQADAAAAHLAARFGAKGRPVPFRPVLRGKLVTPKGDRWLRRDIDRDPAGEVSDRPLWWPAGKLAGPHLGSALARLRGDRLGAPPKDGDVELLMAP